MDIIKLEDLEYKSSFGVNSGKIQSGYRIVYFYPDNSYKVGTFSGCIEDFMMDFVDIEPIDEDTEIPNFISIDDLLDRYLQELNNITGVALYKTDGTLVSKKIKNIKTL